MTHKIDTGLPPRPLDSVAAKPAPRAGTEREAPVAAAAATDSLRLTGEAAGLQAIERELGEGPASIDAARVGAVRAALADGSYRIDPQAIADRMLSFDRDLGR
jgi:negative regulator of flagellin synthesis FlgM